MNSTQHIINALRDGADKTNIAKLDDLELHLYQDTNRNQEGELTLDWRDALKGTLKVGISMLPVVGGSLSEIVKQFDAKSAGGVNDLVKSLKRAQVQVHRERYRHLDEFQDTFTRLLDPLTHARKRLVIFIDDLDRCLPDDAIRVLETIKLYLEAEGCVFVVGIDSQIVEKGIRMRYRDYVASGEPCPISGADYLEKLVQVPFHLPPIDSDKLISYITDLYPDCPFGLPTVCAAGLEPNPRKVKRAINVFRILWSVVVLRADLRDIIDPELMMKLVIIQMRWSNLFLRIKQEPYRLVVLEERVELYDASLGDERELPSPERAQRDLAGAVPEEQFITDERARSQPARDEYAVYANDEFLRNLLKAGDKRFKALPPEQCRKYVFLASTTAVQASEMSLDCWQRLISADEAMMRGACADILELSQSEQDRYRGKLIDAMRMTNSPAKYRCQAGTALAFLGDRRFNDERYYLPKDPPCGFIEIPSGEFPMGSNKVVDADAFDNEHPQHRVTLSPYYIGKYPVTVAQYRAFRQ